MQSDEAVSWALLRGLATVEAALVLIGVQLTLFPFVMHGDWDGSGLESLPVIPGLVLILWRIFLAKRLLPAERIVLSAAVTFSLPLMFASCMEVATTR